MNHAKQEQEGEPNVPRKIIINQNKGALLFFGGAWACLSAIVSIANDMFNGTAWRLTIPVVCVFIALVCFTVRAAIRRIVCSECGNKVTPESKLCPTCRAVF
jgi:hypothetical protein